jgi:arylsulfatase A-like enzyme
MEPPQHLPDDHIMNGLLRLLTLSMLLTNCSFGAAPSRPNVILMLADDLGYGEPGCYGNPQGRTPHIDRLAAQGVRFTKGYAAFNVCSPSRAALLTGRYVHRLGPLFEDYLGARCPGLDPKRDITLGQMAREAGYATACFGKWNVSHNRWMEGNVSIEKDAADNWKPSKKKSPERIDGIVALIMGLERATVQQQVEWYVPGSLSL